MKITFKDNLYPYGPNPAFTRATETYPTEQEILEEIEAYNKLIKLEDPDSIELVFDMDIETFVSVDSFKSCPIPGIKYKVRVFQNKIKWFYPINN